VSTSSEISAQIALALSAEWRDPAVGDRLDSHLLVEHLGAGRYSEVWRAQNIITNSTVAIKIFTPERFPPEDRQAAAERFHKGARAMARLNHPRIVPLKSPPVVSGPFLWFSMAHLPEKDLAGALSRNLLTAEQCAGVFEDIVEATVYSHLQGAVHRDIRPSNILLERDDTGRYRGVLADFDMAYWETVLQSETSTIGNVSLPRYLPEELIRTSPQNAGFKKLVRSPHNDVFALGVVLADIFLGEETIRRLDAEKYMAELAGSRRRFRDGKPPTATLQWKTARTLAAVLDPDKSDLRHATDLLALWTSDGPTPHLKARTVYYLCLSSLVVTLLLVADWTGALFAGTPTGRTIRNAFFTVAGITTFTPVVAWLLRLRGIVPPTGERIARLITWLHTRRTRMRALVLLALAIPLTLIVTIGPIQRLWRYRVASADGCRLVDDSGKEKARVDTDSRVTVHAKDAARMRCRPDKVQAATITPLSVLTPSVPVVADTPDAGVDALPPLSLDAGTTAPAKPTTVKQIAPPPEQTVFAQILTPTMKADDDFERSANLAFSLWPAANQTPTLRLTYFFSPIASKKLLALQRNLRIIATPLLSKATPTYEEAQAIALWGHGEVALMHCEHGLSALAKVVYHHSHSNAVVWIADIARCLALEDQFIYTVTNAKQVSLAPDDRANLEGVLLWIALTDNAGLIDRGIRWRAARLLDAIVADWSASRSVLLERIALFSTVCPELKWAYDEAPGPGSAVAATLARRVAVKSLDSRSCAFLNTL